MLRKVLRKRTRIEKEAWQTLHDLIPRGRKTMGLHYLVLDYLFDHLYEKVTEDAIRQHLLEVRGHLQPTGDPVKVAINLAIKELQRLQETNFELIKIQEIGHNGKMVRNVQLNYTHFEEVVAHQQFEEYLGDLLIDEQGMVLRTINHVTRGDPLNPFPGIEPSRLTLDRTEVLINASISPPGESAGISYKYLPQSIANYQFMLLYENAGSEVPFLGCVADLQPDDETRRYLLYRGVRKLAKLKFLHRIWHTLEQRAIDQTTIERLQKESARLASSLRPTEPAFDQNLLLQALVSRHFDETREDRTASR